MKNCPNIIESLFILFNAFNMNKEDNVHAANITII